MTGGSDRESADRSPDETIDLTERASTDPMESDATNAVIAHGLVNAMTVVKATAATISNNYDELVQEPALLKESLTRLARSADLAVDILELLTRGLPTEVIDELRDSRGPR